MKARRFAPVLLLLGVFLGAVGPAAGSRPDVTVNGGGMATFDPGSGAGLAGTNFAIGAHLRADGTASGHFNCVVPGLVVLSADITSGALNADGSVTFRGTVTTVDLVTKLVFHRGEPFTEFTLTLWEGGPGVGRFLYDDFVVPDPGDFETVAIGSIKIAGND